MKQRAQRPLIDQIKDELNQQLTTIGIIKLQRPMIDLFSVNFFFSFFFFICHFHIHLIGMIKLQRSMIHLFSVNFFLFSFVIFILILNKIKQNMHLIACLFCFYYELIACLFCFYYELINITFNIYMF